ncbi:MAG TPA: energy transducer TonB [Chthoniobacterales bacterium]|nr:energy transducer TonB [Chthoniobacterales bacterium]
MPKNARFWRNVTLIGLAHVVLIVGLIRLSRETKSSSAQSIVWMNGGAGDGAGIQTKNAPTPKTVRATAPQPERTPEPPRKEEAEEERPVLMSTKSEIQLPAATPKPSPRSTATASPVRTLKASPTPKVTPKPTPKTKSKPTPKPSPKKMILAKASPKPSPKIKPTPEATDESDAQSEAEAEKKRIAKAVLAKNETGESDSSEKPVKKASAVQGAGGKGTSPGGGGHAGGAGGESQFGWYGSMLHDRFYSEWVQPTSLASTGAKNSVLVKIRIEKDGRVSSFEVIRPSGNTEIDESVAAVAKRVAQVDPLPAGLGSGDHYDVKINFELNSEQ